jgi:hypothetical protein
MRQTDGHSLHIGNIFPVNNAQHSDSSLSIKHTYRCHLWWYLNVLFQRTEARKKEDYSLQDGATADTSIGRLVFGVQIADKWSPSLPGIKSSN